MSEQRHANKEELKQLALPLIFNSARSTQLRTRHCPEAIGDLIFARKFDGEFDGKGQNQKQPQAASFTYLLKRFGGAKRDRTADLYNAIVALSQLSYSPLLRYLAQNAPNERPAKQPIRFQVVQYLNAARNMYRRGDTLRKKIFVWRRVFYIAVARPMAFANIKQA